MLSMTNGEGKQQHKRLRHKEKFELVIDDAGKSDFNVVQAVEVAF
jgi:hypothetical protein